MKQGLLYAVLWFGAGCAVGFGIRALFGGDAVLLCGAINMASGVIGLLIVTRNEQARKAFYGEGGRGGMVLGLLVGLPVIQLFVSVLWWLMGKVLPP